VRDLAMGGARASIYPRLIDVTPRWNLEQAQAWLEAM
jgi:hypothetical protein